MEGRRALNAEIVVRVHGREPELWSIGRMADCLSAGTGSTPVSSAISLREIRPAARTPASRSGYEGSSPSSPAIAGMVWRLVPRAVCCPAQWQCRELVPLRRVFDSLDQLQISMAGLAEWLRHWIVAPVTRVRFSHLAPNGRFV